MFCIKKITDNITWIGGEDRRLALFESVYPVPNGVSYNSYFIDDDKTIVMDTVDQSVAVQFFENLEHVLAGRKLDYLVVNHMEPDHAATVGELIHRYPECQIVCNAMIKGMLKSYFGIDTDACCHIVKEGDMLETGNMHFTFMMAPMVHWPEVMMTYETSQKVLFTADAFGTFGAMNGYTFADQVDFERDYMDEARRYYTNIVGKYGPQANTVLKKISAIQIEMICPLHGFIWRRDISAMIDKYLHWASYQPEENGVLIAYASVYGHTENAVNVLAEKLVERSIKVKVYDVAHTHPSYVLADAFRFSHIVLAAPTYNAGVFISMENLIHDIVNHNLQNRRITLIENGSWAPTCASLMKSELEKLKGIEFIGDKLTIRSALKESQMAQIDDLADGITKSVWEN